MEYGKSAEVMQIVISCSLDTVMVPGGGIRGPVGPPYIEDPKRPVGHYDPPNIHWDCAGFRMCFISLL